MSGEKNIFTIQAGVPFARALAAQLLEETKGAPERLADYRILLPTRRACAVLRDAFLTLRDAPILLPKLQPLGDVDEEELSLSLAGGEDIILSLPPAITPLRRQALLAKTIMKLPGFTRGFDQALELAAALARFMDQVYTEGLDMAKLVDLAPEGFSEHWQITVKFLEILSATWPTILAEEGVIDAADRRNRLLRAMAKLWAKNPPDGPVIAAGSTGSIPATAELLSVIAALPQGRLILPGLDQEMDEASWNEISESHPQFGLKKLLEHMNEDRTRVKVWPGAQAENTAARRGLLSELMRPAETTGEWTHLATNKNARENFAAALKGLSLYECAREGEEADIIAALLRSALETPGKIAALVTPDRALARRVAMACRRWGISIDDSAGSALDQTPVGIFLRLILEAVINDFAPVSLLALLKHKLCARHEGLAAMDKALRGPKPPPGLAGIAQKLEEEGDAAGLKIIRRLAPIFEKFKETAKARDFKTLLTGHMELAENLSGAENLWSGEDGEAAATFCAGLFDHAGLMPDSGAGDYAAVLNALMKTVTVRPAYGAHPRLAIMGQLEARLTDADLIIMGALNEGVWPNDGGHDPWMSRPMRADFGLPARERNTGLSAHDFAQGFCAGEVILTRSRRQNNAPAAPSRWLQRLDTVLDAANIDKDTLRRGNAFDWVHAMNDAGEPAPQKRPEPRPPVDKRPRRISASRVETWMRDPYGIYARYILNLKKFDPLEKAPDAADRGTLLHKILERFIKEECPGGKLPPQAREVLIRLGEEELGKRHEDPHAWSFWRPRFARIADWLAEHETDWRGQATPVLSELKGAVDLAPPSGPFIIEATPDRIDETPGGAAIIDYKSGGTYSKAGIQTGKLPQLGVEALILARGGFADIAPRGVSHLAYWLLTGGAEAGKITGVGGNIDAIIERTQEGLLEMIAAFDDPETPYFSLPRPDAAPRFNDYERLARVKEWAALGESSDAEAA